MRDSGAGENKRGLDLHSIREKLGKLDKYKYPLIVLLLGLALMLIPTGSSQTDTAQDADALLKQVLSCSQGVGEAQVIVSENGVVVVCQGAEDAKVRFDIIKAIGSYTGFGADKITVLKMAD